MPTTLGRELGWPLGKVLGWPYDALDVLMTAPGAAAFFDFDWGYAADASNKLSLLTSRIGTHTVEQASGPIQPTWGIPSPTGKRGARFATASSTILTKSASALAALLDGVDAHSSLVVCNPNSAGASMATWGAGSSTTTSVVRESLASGVTDRRTRRTAAAGTTNNDGSAVSAAVHCLTSTFDGGAYNSWVDGTLSVNAGANTRSATCDVFSIGGSVESGAGLQYFNGDIWCVLIAVGTVWTTAQRTALQAAAKSYWGTV